MEGFNTGVFAKETIDLLVEYNHQNEIKKLEDAWKEIKDKRDELLKSLENKDLIDVKSKKALDHYNWKMEDIIHSIVILEENYNENIE